MRDRQRTRDKALVLEVVSSDELVLEVVSSDEFALLIRVQFPCLPTHCFLWQRRPSTILGGNVVEIKEKGHGKREKTEGKGSRKTKGKGSRKTKRTRAGKKGTNEQKEKKIETRVEKR